MTVVLTDIKYRMTLAAIRDCIAAGHTVILIHRDDGSVPLGFYAGGTHGDVVLPKEEDAYLDGLLALLRALPERAVLLPCGGATIDLAAAHRPRFDEVCDLLIADSEALALVNDKARIRALAQQCGIRVPEEFAAAPGETPEQLAARLPYPCVIKYVCGEKLGIPAEGRYRIVQRQADFPAAYAEMAARGAVLVQRFLVGGGIGVSLLMDRDGSLRSYLCHRRLREHPASGGPSTCAESVYLPGLVQKAAALLRAAHFVGPAMVEFKGESEDAAFLEINPRLWGSFPLTRVAGAPFTDEWVRAAAGLPAQRADDPPYRVGVKMRFAVSDLLSVPGYLRKGELARALGAVFPGRCRDGLFERGESAVTRAYLKSLLARRRGG